MSEEMIAMCSAFALGVTTSISPCPLATNIAAVMFVTHDIKSPLRIILSGILYSIGRAVLYALLGWAFGAALLSQAAVSAWLGEYMIKLIGPILIITALFVLEFIRFGGWSNEKLESVGTRIARGGGLLGSFFLGVIFAMAFCPITAAIFIGSLLPLELKSQSYFAVPMIFGVGTALPVLIFAAGGAIFSKGFSKLPQRMNVIGRWVKLIAGVAILIIGLYMSFVYVWLA